MELLGEKVHIDILVSLNEVVKLACIEVESIFTSTSNCFQGTSLVV